MKELIKKYPNDADLGKAVRELYKESEYKEPKIIVQKCANCDKEFKGTEKIEICPSCYV